MDSVSYVSKHQQKSFLLYLLLLLSSSETWMYLLAFDWVSSWHTCREKARKHAGNFTGLSTCTSRRFITACLHGSASEVSSMSMFHKMCDLKEILIIWILYNCLFKCVNCFFLFSTIAFALSPDSLDPLTYPHIYKQRYVLNDRGEVRWITYVSALLHVECCLQCQHSNCSKNDQTFNEISGWFSENTNSKLPVQLKLLLNISVSDSYLVFTITPDN